MMELLYQIGTRVIAVRNFGPIKEGQLGIVTGIAAERWLWLSKPIYLCTFADNVKIAARPKEVEDYDHGYSLADLEEAVQHFEVVLVGLTHVAMSGGFQQKATKRERLADVLGDDLDALGGVARYPDCKRVRARLRGECLVGYRRAEKHAR